MGRGRAEALEQLLFPNADIYRNYGDILVKDLVEFAGPGQLTPPCFPNPPAHRLMALPAALAS